ncbi:MAG: sigma-70 family RNA polymerase sigma factor [Bacteroidales bacterium]|nr:sigma-70 family RNA polymerase sigma factor [Bacteroidales bacterium]
MEITQLIERCRQRDAEALSELYMTYSAAMRNVCRWYLSDKQAIDDVVHDSFVIIYTSLDTLRDTDKAVAWMMSITRNVASKYKDYQKKHPTVLATGTETKEPLGSEVQDELTGEIALSELKNLVDKLPEGYGQVFRLAVFEGLSHKEIAALLNIEPHSSASQLARAKKMLRNMMLQSWPILLLLLFPMLYFLFEKEKPITVEEESPVVKQQENTPNLAPIDQEPKPLIVQQPNSCTVISSADRTRLVADYTSDTIGVDTLETIIAQEESVFDTVETNQIQSNLIRMKQFRIMNLPIYIRKSNPMLPINKNGR